MQASCQKTPFTPEKSVHLEGMPAYNYAVKLKCLPVATYGLSL